MVVAKWLGNRTKMPDKNQPDKNPGCVRLDPDINLKDLCPVGPTHSKFSANPQLSSAFSELIKAGQKCRTKILLSGLIKCPATHQEVV